MCYKKCTIWECTKHSWNWIPCKTQQISKFKQQNVDVSVNVFGYEENKFPTTITENRAGRHHVNLLIINNNDIHHYILIKYLSHLLSLQYKSFNRRLYFCPYCLHGCLSQSILDNHHKECNVYGTQNVIFPKKNGKSDKVYCYYSLLNACLKNKFSITTIRLSRHEQVCLSGLNFEWYFSHHRATWMIISRIFKGNMGTFTETIKLTDKVVAQCD